MVDLKRENMELRLQLERAEELVSLYRHDPLTGLQMRRDFDVKFSEFFESKIPFYLTLFDVNGLHNMNREKSYDAGDRLIKYVASKILKASKGFVFRIGGDEFASLSFDPIRFYENDDNFVYASLCSDGYLDEKDFFDSVDIKLVDAKQQFYSTREKDRRK